MSSHSVAEAPFWEMNLVVDAALADDLGAMLILHGAEGTHVHLDEEAPRLHASLGPAPPIGSDNDGAIAKSVTHPQRGVRLVADFSGALGEEDVKDILMLALDELGLLDLGAKARWHRRSDSDWAHTWKQHFKPQKVGRRIWVLPSWETTFVPPLHSVVIRIDPGMAFGTGQHASTAMCLRALESHIDEAKMRQRPVTTVLDVGCGSGILTLGALLLGASEATAVDIDPEAIRATEKNLAEAKLTTRVAASTTPLEKIPGRFDIVVANILAPTLHAMAQDLIQRLCPGGLLLLSGVLASQEHALRKTLMAAAKAQNRHLRDLGTLKMQDWVAMRFWG